MWFVRQLCGHLFTLLTPTFLGGKYINLDYNLDYREFRRVAQTLKT